MIKESTRRDFLKCLLAAATTPVMLPKTLFSRTTPTLFEKTNIKSLVVSNRMMRSSTWSGVGDNRGYVTDKAFKIYGELARGGIGAILKGYQYVMANGPGLPFQIGNYEDQLVAGLRQLVDTVHNNGGKIVFQLVHCLAKADTKLFSKKKLYNHWLGLPMEKQ